MDGTLRLGGNDCPLRHDGAGHIPHEGRADIEDLTDHPRGLRYARGIVYGAQVWVTRCRNCEAPLLCLGPYGHEAADPQAVYELHGATLSEEQNAGLEQQSNGQSR